jgi:hypothetical protein
MSWRANGYLGTSSMLMVHWSATRLAWFARALPSGLGSTTIRCSTRWLNRQPSALSSRWLSHGFGWLISSTSRIPFFMAHTRRLSTAISRSGSFELCMLSQQVSLWTQAGAAGLVQPLLHLSTKAHDFVFTEVKFDTSLFIFHRDSETVYPTMPFFRKPSQLFNMSSPWRTLAHFTTSWASLWSGGQRSCSCTSAPIPRTSSTALARQVRSHVLLVLFYSPSCWGTVDRDASVQARGLVFAPTHQSQGHHWSRWHGRLQAMHYCAQVHSVENTGNLLNMVIWGNNHGVLSHPVHIQFQDQNWMHLFIYVYQDQVSHIKW